MARKRRPVIGSFEEAELRALELGADLTFREKLEYNAEMLALGESFRRQREAARIAERSRAVAEPQPAYGAPGSPPPPHTP